MKERIRDVMTHYHMSQKEFAHETTISESSVSGILNGKSQVTRNHIDSIYNRFPEISLEWLMYGKGSMFPTSDGSHVGSQPMAADEAGSDSDCAAGINPTSEVAPTPAATAAFESLVKEIELLRKQVEDISKKLDTSSHGIREIQVLYDDAIARFIPKPKDK